MSQDIVYGEIDVDDVRYHGSALNPAAVEMLEFHCEPPRGHGPCARHCLLLHRRYLIKRAGFSRKTARTGAVTLIQRFGSALNLNVPLPHVVPERRVRRASRRLTALPLGRCTALD